MVSRFFSPAAFGGAPGNPGIQTAAIQRTIDEAAAAGGGTVVLEPGVWKTGSLFLKSGVVLHLEAGCVLSGSADFSDYPLVMTRWEGSTRLCHAPLIGGNGIENVGVSGPGTIDGNGAGWWKAFRDKTLKHPRPRLIAFEDSRFVTLEGFKASNSPSWTINPVRCDDVRVADVSIANPSDSPNTDGVNPDSCRNVFIRSCRITVGDDCITLKSGTEHEKESLRRSCENVCISDCILEAGHGAVVMGSEMSGGVRNVVISNCIFTGTDRGIRMKSRRGRGGAIENIRVENIVMQDILCPFTVNLRYGCGAWGDPVVSDPGVRPVDSGTPEVRSVHIRGVTALNVKLAAAFIHGLPESPVRSVRLSDWDVTMSPEVVPPAQVEMGDGLPDLSGAGVFARHVVGLELDGVRVRGYRGKLFDIDDCPDAVLPDR